MLAVLDTWRYNHRMTSERQPKLTVKERYQECKQFECPRFLAICETGPDGSKYFTETGLAYSALVLCNNWTLGLSDGECPIDPKVLETTD